MSEQITSKVPQIRFKGFVDEWRQLPVGSVIRDHVERTVVQNQYPVLTSSQKHGIVMQKDYFANRQVTTDKNIGYLVLPKGFFAYRSRSDTDSFVFNRNDVIEKGIISYYYPVFEVKECDSDFFLRRINFGVQRQLSVAAEGTGQRVLAHSQFKKLTTNYPTLSEQTRIGEYFRELDSLIGLHQRKHDKLVALKKSMLQKMFPQPGANIPEIRFKGFSGDWVEMKLHSLADRYDNLRVPVSASNRIPGNTPYYGANGIQDYVDGYTHEGEFILVAEDGANDLKNYPVQYVNGKVWVNNHAHVLQGKKGLAETRFLKYAFSQINFEVFLVGGGRSKLNAETMMQLELCVPTALAEQRKIGAYFRRLDTLISQHAIQLQKLQQIKFACLEKMFV